MANVSNWKGWEREVAELLGGQRRLRTTESYGKKATDVRWPSDVKKKYPFIRDVMVECKKKKSLNIYTEMAIARLKYAKDEGCHIILACKRPAPGSWKKRRKILTKLAVRHMNMDKEKAKKMIRRDMFIGAVYAVSPEFFRELWEAWLERKSKEHIRRSKSSQ